MTERRLAVQLATKDKKLGQLRDAIKELESKLIEAMKRNSDMYAFAFLTTCLLCTK